MDPLTLLQDYASRSQLEKVRLTDTRVEFEDSYTFPRDTLTAYRGRQGKGEFYSLATLLVYLRNAKVKLADYISTAKGLNVSTVHFVDRKELLDFLANTGATSAHVQPGALEQHLATQPQNAEQPTAKRARLAPGAALDAPAGDAAGGAEAGADGSLSLLQEVAQHERQLRDRNSALSVPGKRFTRALEVAAKALRELDPSRQPQRAAAQPAHQNAIPIQPSGRYERGIGENTTVMDLGGEIKIQTYGPGSQAPAAAAATAAPPPPPPPRRASGQPPPPPAADRRHSGQNRSNGHVKSPVGKSPSKRPLLPPIVLVPKGYVAKLNMYNAKVFLEEGRYVSWESMQAEGLKAQEQPFSRSIGCRKPMPYIVSEKAPTDKEGWQRVVAVFVIGKEWQFRGWPFKGVDKGDMVDTFKRVLGVYMCMQNEAVPPLVKSWNVRVLKLHPNDRHSDLQLVRDFYAALDNLVDIRSKR